MPPFLTGRRGTRILFMLSLVLTSFIYYPGLTGDYMFDDKPNLLENQSLSIEKLDGESIKRAAFSSRSGPLRRPVSMTSFALNRHIFGIDPYSYKAINLGIHLLTGIMLYLFSRLLILSYQQHRDTTLPDNATNWIPLVISSIWLIHPLNLTSVLYIVQRMTSLSTLFMVSGLYLYMIGRRRLHEGKPGASITIIGLVFFGSLAILSKEIGALLPIYMLAIEATIFRFRNKQGRTDKFISGFFILTILLPTCLVVVWLTMHPSIILAGYGGRDFTLTERLLTEARVLIFYLKMIIMPSVSALGLQHDDIAISTSLFNPQSTFYSILALFGLAITAFLLHRKQPLVSLGIFWFFIGHLIESTIWPLEIAHEHRNYLAGFGIILALTTAAAKLNAHSPNKLIMLGLPLLYLCMLSYTTRVRAEHWSNSIDHAVFEATHHPRSYRAAYNAGTIYARLALNGQPKSTTDAFNHWEHAQKLNPGEILHLAAMLKFSYRLNQPVNPLWFDELEYRLKHFLFTFRHRDAISTLVNCAGDYCSISNEQMQRIFKALLKSPGLEQRTHMHAEAITLYADYAINNTKNFSTGLDLFRKAVAIEPGQSQYRINLIRVLIHVQQFDAAEKELNEYLNLSVMDRSKTDYETLRSKLDTARKQSISSFTNGSLND